jgi:hypothetical protein
MQSHYLGGEYRNWRLDYNHVPGLPLEFDESLSKTLLKSQPIDSDHYEHYGVPKGFA